ILDQHRLLCGDARSEGDLDRLMGSSQAAMAFLDVPYNVRVRSIGGRGRVKHAEFAFASGEMTPPEYVEFLEGALVNATRLSARLFRTGPLHQGDRADAIGVARDGAQGHSRPQNGVQIRAGSSANAEARRVG